MRGLIENWTQLPPTRIHLRTTSASGPEVECACDAIALQEALAAPVCSRVVARSGDGLSIALSMDDVRGAYLLAQAEGGWRLLLPGDGTRRRFIKHISEFIID